MAAKRELALLSVLTVVLVLLRSFVPAYYEGFFFDSDQAIVGLMARHLSRLRTFPLFYYGLNYMLGVEAWIIAPFFWLGRSSVSLMRLPFVALNVLVAVWLVRAFATRLGLRPAFGFVAALPFIVPTPAASVHLLELAGSCVEPFVYVLLLWSLRRRPLAFGALLAVAYLHREFTIFAVPALALVEVRRPAFWTRANLVRGTWAVAGAALVWLIADDVRMHVAGAPLAAQAASLRGQMCLTRPDLAPRVRAMVTEAVPILLGARPVPLARLRMNTAVVTGSSLVGWLLAATLGTIAVRLLIGRRDRPANPSGVEPSPDEGLGTYLAWVGFFTACAYPLSCNVVPGGPPLLRYLLLAILLPVGCCATFLQRERSRALRTAVVSVFVLWAGVNLWDNVRVIRGALLEPPGSEHRVLVDYLIGQRIRYARAIYWDAYVVDFLSGERVIAASVDIIRIPEYQKQVDEHASAAVNLERLPCAGARRVASWCITGP
jgi:hypothetical protein